MSQFKAMKFWIGDDPELSEKVQNILFYLGYVWYGETQGVVEKTNTTALYTSVNGSITYTDYSSKAGYFDSDPRVEVNIDWMRPPKKETIELNGKKYLKEDLEEALKHLKPVSETYNTCNGSK